jgi:DeoR family transcriptional regulator, glycerol-3-phosphate regulon repressor
MSRRKDERQQRILSELRAKPSTRLQELADMFGVSKETIRRDIGELSERGAVSRTYGGALPSYLNYEPGIQERSLLNPEGRRRMAALAQELIADSGVLMIDAGSTMVHVCEQLVQSVPRDGPVGLTVITNSLKNAIVLAENPAIRILVCPGTYDVGEMAAHGPLTLEFLGRFHAEVVVTSAGGIGPQGPMDANSDAAAVKRAMLKQTNRSVFVMESRKFDYTQFETVCPLSAITDLVTDAPLPPELGTALTGNGVRTHLAATVPAT